MEVLLISLFIVVMFYIVTEQEKAEPLFPGLIQGKVSSSSGHNFINGSIHNFVLCMFLFQGTLFNIYF